MIDGSDASGKSTQAKLLVESLNKAGKNAIYHKFPQYNEFYGQLVAKFLRGELGCLESIDPYLASLPYILDRLSAKQKLLRLLKKYDYVILDRYVPSNIGHQASRFESETARIEFIDWLIQAEYKVNKIPIEDLVIFLHVPTDLSINLQSKATDKSYLNGQKDIIESNYKALKQAELTYLYCALKFSHWKKITCFKDNEILPIQKIQDKILTLFTL
mgnify:CR=1 FL=1